MDLPGPTPTIKVIFIGSEGVRTGTLRHVDKVFSHFTMLRVNWNLPQWFRINVKEAFAILAILSKYTHKITCIFTPMPV